MTARVSVVIPAYCSEVTVERCLAALVRQTYRDFETIVVDSSPDEQTSVIVREQFPSVILVRANRRMLPHAARNRGVQRASGELLVFTDPDIYASAEWLASLVRTYDERKQVIVGSIGCFGSKWLHIGIHLTKFSKWLPRSSSRAVDNGPSGNLLVSRDAFVRAGGFPGDTWSGDVELSRVLRAAGETLWFEPSASGEHHHTQSLAGFVRERVERGFAFGQLRSSWYDGRAAALLVLFAATVFPVRLARNLMLVARQAIDAGAFASYIVSLPIVAVGYIATLAGEAAAYARSIGQRSSRALRMRSKRSRSVASKPMSFGS
jgi:glycosyltransferase involved in cell wall biosynthesis